MGSRWSLRVWFILSPFPRESTTLPSHAINEGQDGGNDETEIMNSKITFMQSQLPITCFQQEVKVWAGNAAFSSINAEEIKSSFTVNPSASV